MKARREPPPSLRRLVVRWGGLPLLAAALVLVLPYLGSGTELVRMRNALSLGPDLAPLHDWPGTTAPKDYRLEEVAPDPYFVAVAARLELAKLPDDWERAVTIARHLLGTAPRLNGGAIQQNLRGTYLGIVQRGDGYCGDFIRAFTAIGHAAGLTIRPWAFSLDGFGGHGHIWAEVWNRELGRWQLVDVFQNYYYVDGGSGALSALELRQKLIARSSDLQLRPLAPLVPPGWEIEAKAWDYLKRGLEEWYLPWGANVFTVDAAVPVRLFSGVSRAAESLGALVAGVQPQVRMLATRENEPRRMAMWQLRQRVQLAGVLGAAGVVWLLGAPLLLRRRAPSACVPVAHGATLSWPHVCVVGPLPPPSGGMANQCEQLLRLLRAEGAVVEHVSTNAPNRPAWIECVPYGRAGFRLLPYLIVLWRSIGRAEVVHVFANSGWAWHLLAAPALAVARVRSVPAIVNYRGGQAGEFLASAPRHVLRGLRGAALLVTPSRFLHEVFARHGLQAEVIPNIVDLTRFTARPMREFGDAPHLIVTRNLEPIYDIPTALRSLARVRARYPRARLTVAGSGPERAALEALSAQLGLQGAVHFAGRIDNADIAPLYADADLMLNPSTADNMPISILEALASGVPVVSTRAGGVPHLVVHESTALLVDVGDAEAMAAAALRVLGDRALAERLAERGVQEAARYAWPAVRPLWQQAYQRVTNADGSPPLAPGVPR